jgi:cytochrome c-type biogenesis protein CcmH/NrfF
MERHPLDPISLTAGLVFAAAGLLALTDALQLGMEDLRWIGPALLVLFGVVLVATSASRRRDEAPSAEERPAADTSASDDATDEVAAGDTSVPTER